jgi:hypothetical protein
VDPVRLRACGTHVGSRPESLGWCSVTRVLLVIAALVAAFLAGATAQANWPVRAAWEDNL